MAGYWEDHDALLTDADARGPALLMIDTDSHPGIWRVRQILHDPEEHHDWAITADVDLAASDRRGEAVVAITSVGNTSSFMTAGP